MAVNSSQEEKLQLPQIMDGNCDIPVSPSCFQLLKPAFAEVSKHCSLDVLPILFEDSSVPLALNCPFHGRRDGQDVYSISVLPEGGQIGSKEASQLAFLSVLEVPPPSESQMCLDTHFKCSNCMDVQRENSDAHSLCFVDIDGAKEDMKVTESNKDTVGNLQSEGDGTHLLRVFGQRQESLKMGEKIVQLLVSHGLTLLKLTSREPRRRQWILDTVSHQIDQNAFSWFFGLQKLRSSIILSRYDIPDKSMVERVHDMPTNRWRRYKRAAFFDSRTVVLTFSIMSIFGTLILIYLTLRVSQAADTIGRV